MKKLYVACAITNVPPEEKVRFSRDIDILKAELRKYFHVLDFVGNAEGEPEKIYQFDIHECVMKADYMLAVCDHPSTGLGYEMAMAIEKRGIPVLAVAHEESRVTRLVVGITGKKFTLVRYKDLGEIVPLVRSYFTL